MANRFGFDKSLVHLLTNLDAIPQTQPNPLPGIGGRLFIITKIQQEAIRNIINRLDQVSNNEFIQMSPKEKVLFSTLLNNAERVLKNSAVYAG